MGSAIANALAKLAEGQPLDAALAESVMDEVMGGQATSAQIGAILMALRMRGESAAEISGFARSMRRHAVPVAVARRPLLDTCGTGGDGSHSFNISTVAALVVAGAGVTVAKHGNRSATSKAGSADLLEALGVALSPEATVLSRMIDEAGFGFLFAQSVHTAMRHVAPARRELGVRTVFNLLGPLTNPLQPEYQLIGIFDAARLKLMAEALADLGVDHGVVVHGDGLDEVTVSGVTQWARVDRGQLSFGTWTPEELGVSRYPKSALVGGDAEKNAILCREVLSGENGPYREVVLANAAVALWAARAVDDPRSGVKLAAESIDSGRAEAVLNRIRELSTS
jgi:anthranilate phosphoribosyltransferase